MRFNKHSELKGAHAFLSASKYSWDRYDEERLTEVFRTAQAARRGDELHEFAKEAIRLGVRLRGTNTLAAYVNDAIGFKLSPEQVLVYSMNVFGTADTIGLRGRTLRIHDLKTGEKPGDFRQLKIYAALFCLEYGERPGELDIELRIYQNDEVQVYIPPVEDIAELMSRIITFDKVIERLKVEEGT